jgi:FlaA1/EpsC-like NDP-sugar epimerase
LPRRPPRSFYGGSPLLLDWLDAATLRRSGGALSLCCIVAFYYNDLYDLSVVRSFAEFATRLLQSLGVALVLLAGFYTLFPDMRLGDGALVPSLLVIVGLLLPIRAVGYAVMRRRAFADRVLILGTGPLARKLIEEIEARPHYRYQIVGVADDGQVGTDEPMKYPCSGRSSTSTRSSTR